MKLTTAVAGLCLMVVMVTAKPSKRFISFERIKNGLGHLGHEIEHGVQHAGHEIEHGVQHAGHEIEHGLHHFGHEVEEGAQHAGHEIDHFGHEVEQGAQHVSHELENAIHQLRRITGIHNAHDLACKLYPIVKLMGEMECRSVCVGGAGVVLARLCPVACSMVFHEADKLVGC